MTRVTFLRHCKRDEFQIPFDIDIISSHEKIIDETYHHN